MRFSFPREGKIPQILSVAKRRVGQKGAVLAIRAKYGALVPKRETPEKSGAKFSEHIIGAAVNFLPTEFTTWTAERADRWSPAFQMQDPYTTVCILAHSLNSDARKIHKISNRVNADFNDFSDFFKKIILPQNLLTISIFPPSSCSVQKTNYGKP